MTEIVNSPPGGNEAQSKKQPSPKPEITESNAVSSNSRNASIVGLGNKAIANQQRKNLEPTNKAILSALAGKYGVQEKEVFAVFQKNTNKTFRTVSRLQKLQLNLLSKATKTLPRTAKLLTTVVNVGWNILKAPHIVSRSFIEGPLVKPVTTGMEMIPWAGGFFSWLTKIAIMAYSYVIQFWLFNGVVYYTVLFIKGEESVTLDLPYYGETQLNLRNISGEGIGIPSLNMPRYGIPSLPSAAKGYVKFQREFMNIFWNFIKKEMDTPETKDIVNEMKDTVTEYTEKIIENFVVRPFTKGTLAIAERVTNQLDEGLNKIGEKSPVHGLAIKGFKKGIGVVGKMVDKSSLPRAIGYNEPSVVNNENFLALPYYNNNSAFARNQ